MKHFSLLTNVKNFCFYLIATAAILVQAESQIEPAQAIIVDGSQSFDFGVLSVIPIDTQYMPISIYSYLDSCGADSIKKVFPDFNPVDTIFTRPSGKVVKLNNLSLIYRVYFSSEIDWAAFDSGYMAIDGAAFTSPVPITEMTEIFPTDTIFYNPTQGYLRNWRTDSTQGATGVSVAWEKTRGKANQKIGLIDTGVQGSHPDLAGRIAGGLQTDNVGHGTRMAGIMVANTNNYIGVAGINWRAKLYTLSSNNIPIAIWGCTEEQANPINMSFRNWNAASDQASACGYAWLSDHVLVASTGNDASSAATYPAAFKSVFSVGANNTITGSIEPFSNQGHGIQVTAPGDFIAMISHNGGYTIEYGTSASTAMVTGIISLLKAAEPSLLADEIEAVVQLTARDRGASGYDDVYGWGIVSADSAVNYVRKHNFIRMSGPYTTLTQTQGTHQHSFYRQELLHGIAAGTYFTQTYSAKRYFDFSQYNLTQPPTVILRPRDIDGYSFANANDQFPWARIVNGTLTSTGCWVETVAYKITNINGQSIWLPCPDGNCQSAPDVDLQVTVVVPNIPNILPVPSQFASLQAALDFARDNDTIVIAPGTYTGSGNKNLDVNGKKLIIRSSGGAASTIIDCQGSGRAFQFDNFETPDCKLVGITIQNGNDPQYGGGIYFGSGSPTIDSCIFTNCTAPNGGACYFASDFQTYNPSLKACSFLGNNTSQKGGAIYFGRHSHARISNCTFKGNSASGTGVGGAIFVDTMSSIDVQIDSCVFDSNLAVNGGGAIRVEGKANIFANTFVKNSSTNNGSVVDATGANAIVTLNRLNITNNLGGAIKASSSASITLSCSNFYQNTSNIASGSTFNPTIPSGTLIAQNPIYCNYATGDYSLRWDSPCGPSLVPGACVGLPIGAKGIGCTPAITLSAPANASIQTENSPAFDWNDIPGNYAVRYKLLVDDDPAFGSPLIDSTNLSVSSLAATNLFRVKNWYWKVRARNHFTSNPADTMLSEWSAVHSFWSVCGDAKNQSTNPSIQDVVYLVQYLYNGGPAPVYYNSGNVNGIGIITTADVSYLVAYLFNNGEFPTCP